MATFSVFLTRSLAVGNQQLGGNTTFEGNLLEQYGNDLTAGQNPTIPFEFGGDELVVLFFVASVDMTLNPDVGPTIDLVANVPYMWSNDSGITNPYAGVDPSSYVVTNVLAGTLQMCALTQV